MKSTTKPFVQSAIPPTRGHQKTSKLITAPAVFERYTGDPVFPYLVSFPRTGSHWLRMMIELVFGRPTLRRVFYHFDRDDYLCLHSHDLDFDVVRQSVIYLYREPVETVYSQLRYHREDPADPDAVHRWASHYGSHLQHWLEDETFTRRKTLVRYDRMGNDLESEFGKIAAHFGEQLDVRRLHDAASSVTKREVKNRTPHDPQVMNLSTDYQARAAFKEQMSQAVRDDVFGAHPELPRWFD